MQVVESTRDEIVSAFRENRITIYAIARRYCGDDAAADVTQEVFLRVWNNPNGFDAVRGNLRQYMLTMARGIAIDHLRRQSSRRRRDVRHAAGEQDIEQDLARPLIDSEVAERVHRALEQLHANERQPILMAYFGEMTYREVAIRLGVAEGTAKSRIRSGLTKLRLELGGEFALPGAAP